MLLTAVTVVLASLLLCKYVLYLSTYIPSCEYNCNMGNVIFYLDIEVYAFLQYIYI